MYRLRTFACSPGCPPWIILSVACFLTAPAATGQADEGEHQLHSFQRIELTDTYFSEGASAGDINGDGVDDVVYGPYWFAGPSFQEKKEIYPAVPQDRERYADNFFSWVHDFNADGHADIFVVGFPGTPAYVYENPGPAGFDKHWAKHQVFDWVSNESPQFTDLVGDDRPELVCTRDGFFGYATIDWDQPWKNWQFHPISEQIAASRFGHGLGVGDVNGDGLNDIIHSAGWYQQPATEPGEKRWQRHQHAFTQSYGGAEMYAYDVDGDGDNDIITSDAAHDFGLGWYEQRSDNGQLQFHYHQIMGSHPAENEFGVLFSELHSVNLADVDGDGLKDIVTGKTYYSHHQQSPLWNAGAVVFWFRLERSDAGVRWIPYQADGEAGIGRQLTVDDINDDGLLDFVVGGMKGANVLVHQKKAVTESVWQAAQPTIYTGPKPPSVDNARALRGPKATFAADARQVDGALEGEALQVNTTGGRTSIQSMANFAGDRWSGDQQLFWTGAKPGDTLVVDLPKMKTASTLEISLTCASDYAIVQLTLDDQPLGDPIDLYDRQVVTTGVLKFTGLRSAADTPQLKIQIAGANPQAKKAYMVGIDFLRLSAE